jgi:hypothetical protein
MSRRVEAVGVIASLAILAGTVFLASRAKAVPEEMEQLSLIPTVDKIVRSQNMGELEIWYMYIGQQYFTGQINRETYETLYQAYVTRFYELIGLNP